MKQYPPGSDQLDLWDGTCVLGMDLSMLPWRGRSPRGLTRVALGIILKAQAGEERSNLYVDEDQIVLWADRLKGPFVYEGAPLLLEI